MCLFIIVILATILSRNSAFPVSYKIFPVHPITHVRVKDDFLVLAAPANRLTVYDAWEGGEILQKIEVANGLINEIDLNRGMLLTQYYDVCKKLHTSFLTNLKVCSSDFCATSQTPPIASVITQIGYETLGVTLSINGDFTCFSTKGIKLEGHLPITSAMAAAHIDGQWVVTCSGDNHIMVYDLLSSKLIYDIELPNNCQVLKLNLDGDMIHFFTKTGMVYETRVPGSFKTKQIYLDPLLKVPVDTFRPGKDGTNLVTREGYLGIVTSATSMWKRIAQHECFDFDPENHHVVWYNPFRRCVQSQRFILQ